MIIEFFKHFWNWFRIATIKFDLVNILETVIVRGYRNSCNIAKCQSPKKTVSISSNLPIRIQSRQLSKQFIPYLLIIEIIYFYFNFLSLWKCICWILYLLNFLFQFCVLTHWKDGLWLVYLTDVGFYLTFHLFCFFVLFWYVIIFKHTYTLCISSVIILVINFWCKSIVKIQTRSFWF